MKFDFSFLLAFFALSQSALAGSTEFVKYSGLGYSGSYKDITSLSSNGCSSTSKSFSGNLAPFDEDLSVHIRGPINLKKFAVYTAKSSTKKKRELHHQHVKRDASVKIVDVTETIYVTEDDDTPKSAVTSTVSLQNSAQNKVIDKYYTSDKPSSHSVASSASKTVTSSASSSTSTAAGDWSRISYYDSSAGKADNVVFMSHNGGAGSGVFDTTFGMSLSYSNAKGTGGASKATVLSDTTLPSDQELVLFQNVECDSSCGYYREGIPAKKGWDGTLKIFAFSFSMPDAGSGSGNNWNLPAVWLLNGRIPRTVEYPTDEKCSCWSTGCGELDLWEVITGKTSQLTNHIHDGQSKGGNQDGTRWGGGGSSDYFDRPTGSAEDYVAVFDGSHIYLRKVDSFDFGSSIDASTISGWIKGTASEAIIV